MGNRDLYPAEPDNEAILDYAPGSAERASIEGRLESMWSETPEIPCIVDGKEIFTGNIREQRCPHDHSRVLARWHRATPEVVKMAVDAANNSSTIGPLRNASSPCSEIARKVAASSGWRIMLPTGRALPSSSSRRRRHKGSSIKLFAAADKPRFSRAEIGKPSLAKRIAGANNRAHGNLPHSR